MKIIILLLTISFLSACSSLMNAEGAMQPVMVVNAKEQVMFTSCSGAVEDWASCQRKAMKACPNSYEVLEKIESAIGGKREITFKCK